jgi:hypothetical protein
LVILKHAALMKKASLFSPSLRPWLPGVRNSSYKGNTTRSKAVSWASGALGSDPNGLRRDFLSLARKAKFPE